MRSIEEWATHCHVHHYLGLGCAAGPMLLCVDCARAYAREVGELVREESRHQAEKSHTVVDCYTHILTPELCHQTVAAAILQIEVKTP